MILFHSILDLKVWLGMYSVGGVAGSCEDETCGDGSTYHWDDANRTVFEWSTAYAEYGMKKDKAKQVCASVRNKKMVGSQCHWFRAYLCELECIQPGTICKE